MKEDITVEEGYYISLIFFSELWPLVEPNVQESEEMKAANMLFFCVVTIGEEASSEWKEAIFRAKEITSDKLREAKLSESDLFLCAIEFCKLHNERWEGNLNYTLNLLESMRTNPENHPKEWAVWKTAMTLVIINKMSCGHFDWW